MDFNKVTKVMINISMVSYMTFFLRKYHDQKSKFPERKISPPTKIFFLPSFAKKTREGGSWSGRRLFRGRRGGGSTNRSKRNTRGTRGGSLLAGGPRLFAACAVCRRHGVNFSWEYLAAVRGALRRRLARTDTPSVATLLSINGRTHANGHFTFPPMDTWKFNRGPVTVRNRARVRRRGLTEMRTSLRSRVRPFTCSRWGENL